MKKEEFADLLGEIDAQYVAEAHAAQARRPARLRWSILAACLCLLIGGTTVYAASGHGVWITEMFAGDDEWGYDLALMIEKIDTNELSPKLRAVGSVIVQQYKDYEWYNSHYPGSWDKDFTTSAAARQYIGYTPLVALDWEPEETRTHLSVLGTPEGKLQTIHLDTDYTVGNIRLQAASVIYTKHYTGELTTGLRTAENVTFSQTDETTTSGLPWLFVRSSPMESGWSGLDGYLVRDGVLYRLHIAYLAEDAAEAERLMFEWANCF